jgi:hypothetical protein
MPIALPMLRTRLKNAVPSTRNSIGSGRPAALVVFTHSRPAPRAAGHRKSAPASAKSNKQVRFRRLSTAGVTTYPGLVLAQKQSANPRRTERQFNGKSNERLQAVQNRDCRRCGCTRKHRDLDGRFGAWRRPRWWWWWWRRSFWRWWRRSFRWWWRRSFWRGWTHRRWPLRRSSARRRTLRWRTKRRSSAWIWRTILLWRPVFGLRVLAV